MVSVGKTPGRMRSGCQRRRTRPNGCCRKPSGSRWLGPGRTPPGTGAMARRDSASTRTGRTRRSEKRTAASRHGLCHAGRGARTLRRPEATEPMRGGCGTCWATRGSASRTAGMRTTGERRRTAVPRCPSELARAGSCVAVPGTVGPTCYGPPSAAAINPETATSTPGSALPVGGTKGAGSPTAPDTLGGYAPAYLKRAFSSVERGLSSVGTIFSTSTW